MLSRAHIADAVRFWETGRIGYNLVLAVIVLAFAFATGEKWMQWLAASPTLIALGVLANVLYCAAYPADLLVQASEFRTAWRSWRWMAWTAGMLLSAALACAALPELLNWR
jgi:hypothetical protein